MLIRVDFGAEYSGRHYCWCGCGEIENQCRETNQEQTDSVSVEHHVTQPCLFVRVMRLGLTQLWLRSPGSVFG
jgi:hypothetical protein